MMTGFKIGNYLNLTAISNPEDVARNICRYPEVTYSPGELDEKIQKTGRLTDNSLLAILTGRRRDQKTELTLNKINTGMVPFRLADTVRRRTILTNRVTRG